MKILPSNSTKPTASKAPFPTVTMQRKAMKDGNVGANGDTTPNKAIITTPNKKGNRRPYLSLTVPQIKPPMMAAMPVL